MNGARQTTDSLKDKIETAASRRDIELDSIRVIADNDDQRTFRVLETDAETEADQVGFQVTHPGGPTGDSMFDRQLNNAMDNLRAYLNGEDPNEATDDADALEDQSTGDDAEYPEPESENADGSVMTDAFEDSRETTETAEDPEPENPKRVEPSASAQITVAFDDDQIDEIREMFQETTDEIAESHEDLDERIDELDDRISRLEEALSGLAQVSADE